MRLLLAAASLMMLAACTDAEAPDTAKIELRGIYIEPAYQGEAILVDHEAIPGRMPAMKMAFRLYTPALLDSLTEGARVALTLDSATLEVLDVRTLPFDTVLELDRGNADGKGAIILPSETE